ncbi:MAG: FAD-dependent oxidoreductase [Phycisphaerales bacterium]|nr:MAG: FAD-dependent oxidoreductase [Phycisphaerales bacterium]
MEVDAVIFGGGAAGLWSLDALHRAGYRVLLLEAGDLGSGQTITSQGIIHGGLKYTLTGLLTPSAQAIRTMPGRWRRCLAGEDEPDLSRTRLRAHYCHLWRSKSFRSRLAMIGARAGLQVAPVPLDPEERPAVLRDCPGTVARLDEQVIEPASFVEDLANRHRARLLQIDCANGLEFVTPSAGQVELVRLINPESGDAIDLAPRCVILLAGGGNAPMREQIGLNTERTQRRPLHMVLARGSLPTLNAHCVDGTSTRLTITTTRDANGRDIWQIGGQIAERGVNLEPEALVRETARELRETLPELNLTGTQWATYRVDRAESAARGKRPDSISVVEDGNVLTGWPTKLALVPMLADEVLQRMRDRVAPAEDDRTAARHAHFEDWPRPRVALPPWETISTWITVDSAEPV